PRTILLFAGLAILGTATAELQDPTQPSYVVAGEEMEVNAGALRVSAIFISGERRIAIVNGRRLRVGDVLDGVSVSRIEQDRVSFVRGEEVFAVSLLSGSSRQ
ncbi:MAG: general secretion pathway protein GspB, partial [Gammaproteobacteria bacterium]|nr:general secretion pathway protein GspB [Gammaproteobacteria bacterium]